MEKEKIVREIEKIVRRVLNDDTIVITEKTYLKSLPGWNKLVYIVLINALERKYHISLKIYRHKLCLNIFFLVRQINYLLLCKKYLL